MYYFVLKIHWENYQNITSDLSVKESGNLQLWKSKYVLNYRKNHREFHLMLLTIVAQFKGLSLLSLFEPNSIHLMHRLYFSSSQCRTIRLGNDFSEVIFSKDIIFLHIYNMEGKSFSRRVLFKFTCQLHDPNLKKKRFSKSVKLVNLRTEWYHFLKMYFFHQNLGFFCKNSEIFKFGKSERNIVKKTLSFF